MARLYLEALGYHEPKLKGNLLKEKEKYGFTKIDTYNLDITMTELIYERLMLFQENQNLSLDKEVLIGEDYRTIQSILDEMLILSRKILETYYQSNMYNILKEESKKLWYLWSQSFHQFWW